MDPIAERIASNMMSGTPVGELLSKFASAESRASYIEWTGNPVTKLVAATVSEMALRGPVNAQDPLVQYGITLGLGIAAHLMRVPEVVFPMMFSEEPGQPGAPAAETYSTAPDQA